MPLFDSSPACMPGLRFWLPGPVRRRLAPNAGEVSRFSRVQFPGSRTALRLRRIRRNSRFPPLDFACPLRPHGRHPEFVFRSSIPRSPVPLSTLHPPPHSAWRKTRGQDGSLLLSCGALSSPAARRFIPMLSVAYAYRLGYLRAPCASRSSRRCRSTARCSSMRRSRSSCSFALASCSSTRFEYSADCPGVSMARICAV